MADVGQGSCVKIASGQRSSVDTWSRLVTTRMRALLEYHCRHAQDGHRKWRHLTIRQMRALPCGTLCRGVSSEICTLLSLLPWCLLASWRVSAGTPTGFQVAWLRAHRARHGITSTVLVSRTLVSHQTGYVTHVSTRLVALLQLCPHHPIARPQHSAAMVVSHHRHSEETTKPLHWRRLPCSPENPLAQQQAASLLRHRKHQVGNESVLVFCHTATSGV